MSRENHALHEHTFIQSTEARLDDFLAQGREVLDNLVDQRNMLKGTQRMLLDSANTLGLSRDVIGWIERRRWAANHLFSIFFIVLCPRWSAREALHLAWGLRKFACWLDFGFYLQYAGYVHLLRWRHLHVFLLLSDMEVSGLIAHVHVVPLGSLSCQFFFRWCRTPYNSIPLYLAIHLSRHRIWQARRLHKLGATLTVFTSASSRIYPLALGCTVECTAKSSIIRAFR